MVSNDLLLVAFVLTDQSFPSSLPVEEDGECIKIVRFENGTLHDLVTAFLEATRGFLMPARTCIMLSSASHLAWIGTAAYAAEFVAARRRLLAAFRGAITVIHGFPILHLSTDNRAFIRALVDINSWIQQLGLDRDISSTRALLISTICGTVPDPDPPGSPLAPGKSGSPLASDSNTGTSLTPAATAPEPIRFMLPSDLDGKNMAVYESAHSHLPQSVQMEDDVKQCLIDSLVEELNLKFLTELGTPSLHSSGLASNDGGMEKIVVVGRSHAARLVKELEKIGHVVINLARPGFRITEESVSDLVDRINAATNKGPVVFVFHMYDNNCFFSLLPDGSKSLPKRSTQDGKFHMPGQLEMIDKSAFKFIHNLSVPVLQAAGNNKKIIF
jgi:hypothetical protein